MVTALVCAILMSALGIGAITTSVHPWKSNEVASTHATSITTSTSVSTAASSIDAGRGVMSVLAPGTPGLLDHARGWLRDASAQGLMDEEAADEPAPSAPTASDLTALPEPDPPVEPSAAPEEPDEPELPLEPQDPEPLPIPQTEPPSAPLPEPLLPEVPLVDSVVDDVTHEVDGVVDAVTDTLSG